MSAWQPIDENTPKDRRILVRNAQKFCNCARQQFNFTERKHEWVVAEISEGKGAGLSLIFDDPIEWAEIPE